MKKSLIYLFTSLVILTNCVSQQKVDFQNGDIIFQTTSSSQCEAVQLATHSQYSHCGMLYFKNNRWYVLEAVGPVKFTLLKEFISHGKNKHYVIKRVKDFTKEKWQQQDSSIQKFIHQQLGKPYDIYFNWDENNIYCSELVWKFYHTCFNIEVGKLQQMKEFDLKHPAVQAILQERYGKHIPYHEKVISPASIFESSTLILIEEN